MTNEGRDLHPVDASYLDGYGLALWVAEQTDLPLEIVSDVLHIELEFMALVGIAEAPADYRFRFYAEDDLAGVPPIVDTLALAQDCAVRFGIEESTAHSIFEAEARFLAMRGYANG